MNISWLLLAASLQFGYMSGDVCDYLKPIVSVGDLYIEQPLYTTFDFDIQAYNLFIGGSVDTFFYKNTYNLGFLPYSTTYIFKAGFRFDSIEIGYLHSCFHPISPYSMIVGRERWVVPRFEGSLDDIYIRFEFKSGGR